MTPPQAAGHGGTFTEIIESRDFLALRAARAEGSTAVSRLPHRARDSLGRGRLQEGASAGYEFGHLLL